MDAIGDRVGKPGLSFEAQCEDKDITGAVLREVVNHGRISKLQKFEVIIRHNGDIDSNHDSDLTLTLSLILTRIQTLTLTGP